MPPSVQTRLFLAVGHGNATGQIELFAVDPASGQLAPHGSLEAGSSSSFIAFHPNRRRAYTTQNRADRVTAWAIDGDAGTMLRLGEAPVPGAPGAGQVGPAYVSVDHRGRAVLLANYRGHNAVAYALDQDGGLGPITANVSAGQHAHCVVLSPDNRIAFVPHLGADLVAQYRFDETTGGLVPHDPPAVTTAPGSGPRHLTFAPDGQHAFLLTELDAMLYGYRYDASRGTLVELWRAETLPADYHGRRWAADIHVHPAGDTVYVSNRAHDSVSVFALAAGDAPPALVQTVSCGGKSPRNFCLDPAGRFLFVANQDSSNLVTFAIDETSPTTRRLTQIADHPVADAPYFAQFLPPRASPGG